MLYDDRSLPSAQVQPVVAHTLRAHLLQFLRPVAQRLAAQLDIRLVQTAVDLVQVILTHRHRALGLLLTELGGYLLSPNQAPAGAKRISNLIPCCGLVGRRYRRALVAAGQCAGAGLGAGWRGGLAGLGRQCLGKARKPGECGLVCGTLGQSAPPQPPPQGDDDTAQGATNSGARPALGRAGDRGDGRAADPGTPGVVDDTRRACHQPTCSRSSAARPQ